MRGYIVPDLVRTFSIKHEERRKGELRWLVNEEEFREPGSGATVRRSLLRHWGIACIVPITGRGDVLLLDQYRYSFDANVLEIPAGTIRADFENGYARPAEAPEEAVRRELQEEAHCIAGRMEPLGHLSLAPCTSDMVAHLFLAVDLVEAVADRDEGEIIEGIRTLSFSDAMAKIASGEIWDAKTIIGLTRAQEYLARQREKTRDQLR